MTVSGPGRDRRSRTWSATAGRVRDLGSAGIRLDTHVTAIPATGALPPGHQYARIVELCRTTRAVAELAARVDVPVAVMAAMVAELRESGWVSVGEPLDLSGDTVITTALLERIRDGLLRHAY